MPVLNTTSPAEGRGAPKLSPTRVVPSSSTSFIRGTSIIGGAPYGRPPKATRPEVLHFFHHGISDDDAHPRSVLGAPRLRAARPSQIARCARSGRGAARRSVGRKTPE